MKEVFEKQNDGILVNKKIISRDLWDFFSFVKDDTLTSQFFKDLLKVEELCIEDDVFRFSVIEWIALSKKVAPKLFQGIIFGLIQSGKTLLLWLILYTHTVLLNEKTIFCGPSDIGIMEQNMKGLNDVIFKHFVIDDDRTEAEQKERMLKLQFFENDIKQFMNSKKGVSCS